MFGASSGVFAVLVIGALLVFLAGVLIGGLVTRRRSGRSRTPGSLKAAEVERRHALEEKDRARATLQAAIEQLPEGVLIARAPDAAISMLNSAALEILGETRDSLFETRDVLEPTHWPTFHPNGTPRAPEERWLSRAVLKDETVKDEEVIVRRRDGTARWALGSAAPIRDDEGRTVGGVAVFRDITARKEAEEEQRRLQEKLRRAESLSAVGSLVAGVAHEVRNPLFSISATLDAFEARFGREEASPYLDVLHKEVSRLRALMLDLLEYGRASAAEPEPASLGEVVTRACATCNTEAARRGVELRLRVPDRLAPVLIDRERVREVFLNLLENAIQHSPSGEAVVIEARNVAEDDVAWIECSVRDRGPGFPTEDLAQVFDPFFSHRPGGTGMGLSIVKRIVEDHGGTVDADNHEDGGAIVRVRFPAARRDAGRPAARNAGSA